MGHDNIYLTIMGTQADAPVLLSVGAKPQQPLLLDVPVGKTPGLPELGGLGRATASSAPRAWCRCTAARTCACCCRWTAPMMKRYSAPTCAPR